MHFMPRTSCVYEGVLSVDWSRTGLFFKSKDCERLDDMPFLAAISIVNGAKPTQYLSKLTGIESSTSILL